MPRSPRLPNQTRRRNTQPDMQTPDHRRGQLALAVKHLIHPVPLSNPGLQVFGFESLLPHAEQNHLYRVRRTHGVMLGFIRFDQCDHGLEVRACVAGNLMKHKTLLQTKMHPSRGRYDGFIKPFVVK